jgi:HEAT repeat protein
MLRAKTVLTALTVALALSGTAPAADKASLDDAFAKLAAYDFGSDSTPTTVVANLVTASYGKPAERKELAARLAGVLKSAAPRGAKDCACRQLSIIGTADEVPALAGLLTDENLSHMARYALERIPGPAADEAIRQALAKVKGKLLVGMINSLGNRRVTGAADGLAKLVSDADPAVAQAAAAALGKIGPAACSPLEQALDRAPATVRPVVAQALVLCAEGLVAQGQRDQAAALYDRLVKTDVKSVRIAAARGAVLARQAAGVPILMTQLKGSDPDLFRAAMVLVREMPGAEITKALAGELAALPAEKQVLLLDAMADRGDRAGTSAVLALTQAGDSKVRVAAIRALTKLGNASAVPALLDLATGGDAEVAQAAAASLASLSGKDVDAAVQALLDRPDAKARRVAIDVLGQRRVVTAAPALLKAAADPDESVRLAAAKALGETATQGDLPGVVELIVRAKAGNELAAIEAALASACARVPDREACAAIVAPAIAKADAEARSALLRIMGGLGGSKALDAVRTAVKDGAENVRETAIRVLAKWSDPAATGDLAALAKASQNKTHKILALQGYIRLIGQGTQPVDQKLAQCKDALGLAERDEEKKLVLGVLGGVPSVEALTVVVPFLANPAAKDEAAAAAVAIGEKTAGSHAAQTADAMKKVLAATTNADLQKKAKEVLQRAKAFSTPQTSVKQSDK